MGLVSGSESHQSRGPGCKHHRHRLHDILLHRGLRAGHPGHSGTHRRPGARFNTLKIAKVWKYHKNKKYFQNVTPINIKHRYVHNSFSNWTFVIIDCYEDFCDVFSVLNCTPDQERKLGVHKLPDPPGDWISLLGADEHRGGAGQRREDERVQGEQRYGTLIAD